MGRRKQKKDVYKRQVFLMMMGAFYSDPSLALWNMILCMAVFAGAYVMLYRSGCSWLHLAAAAAVLPLPMICLLYTSLSI